MNGPRLPHLRAGAAVLALGALLLTGCMGSAENSAFNAINASRAANGVAGLSTNDALTAKAQGWAQHLANASGGQCTSATLSHSNLATGAPAGWSKLGENVACRTTNTGVDNAIGPIQTQFMGSPGHRANILDAVFNRGGVGVASVPAASGGGYIVVFETQEFAHL
jgi:uncharacterized protein YkwD